MHQRAARAAARLAQAALLMLWAVACTHAAPRTGSDPAIPGAPGLRYQVVYRDARLEVTIDRLSPNEERFAFTQPGGVAQVEIWNRRSHRRVSVGADGIVRLAAEDERIRYHYDLERELERRGPSLFQGLAAGADRHLAGRSYLLRPMVAKSEVQVDFRYSGPTALLPWPLDEDGRAPLTAPDLVDSGFHGFGGRRCSRSVGESRLEVLVQGEDSGRDAAICDWIARAAAEVTSVRDRFPHPYVSVRVVPVAKGDRVHFGMVLWSSPPSITVLIGDAVSNETLKEDWVAPHELLHLAHPVFLPRIPWLSEGLSTYLTELAAARTGRQSAEQTWRELLAGFERGKASTGQRTMRRQAVYETAPGTYWTGALLVLELDVLLRQATGGARGVEHVLDAMTTPVATVEDFGRRVDGVAGRTLFEDVLAAHLDAPAFSRLPAVLASLGIVRSEEKWVLTSGEGAHIREAILAPRAAQH